MDYRISRLLQSDTTGSIMYLKSTQKVSYSNYSVSVFTFMWGQIGYIKWRTQ